jgi:glycosyltransferase involved in cell wall biosynthesis
MNEIKLTIGIPSIPSRIRIGLEPLISKLQSQIKDRKDVEILSILDNKCMSIGRKRQALFQLAQGKYSCILDDDDDVYPNFIEEVLSAIEKNDVDVITYEQEADIDGKILYVIPSIHNVTKETSSPVYDEKTSRWIIKRRPWHWCCWKNSIRKRSFFTNSNWGEDGLFAEMATSFSKTEFFIPKPLVKYVFRQSATSAPYNLPTGDLLKPVELFLSDKQNGE